MKPPPLPPALPALADLIDDLDDIDVNGQASAKHLLAQLVEGYNRQNHAIIAQNRVLREIAEQFHEAWKFARDAAIQARNNDQRVTELKRDVQRSGLEVRPTGSFIIPPEVAEVVASHARRKKVEAQEEEDKRKLILSLKEKIIFALIVLGAMLLAAGCTVVIYEISKHGPSVPMLPGGP
jgi:cell division protein YceG involved in septum cleavage